MIQPIQSVEEYNEQYQLSIDNPERFWETQAQQFEWKKPWDKVLDWNFTDPSIQWFSNAQLNITENCLDRHLAERGDQAAIIWEPNNPTDPAKTFTYKELHEKVCQLANTLQQMGVSKGDRICFYMPMIPELAIGVLACARVGAIHSVVFAGFSAKALTDRINDSQCKWILTADTAQRGSKTIPIKAVVDEALIQCDSVQNVLVYHHTNDSINWNKDIDLNWNELIQNATTTHQAVAVDAEDPLFILYTSGSTGKPKGVVHTCGGYMVYTAYSFANVFQYEAKDMYWCTADIGWITGHSYIVYGPLLNGATTVMFEGIPTWPDAGRFWEIVDKHAVNQFYTAPTAIRALMAQGDEWVGKANLSSLKTLGSVGEPINEEAWHWYNEKVGNKNCAIVDTWWQTETGGIMISSLAGVTDTKPCYATKPLPGIQPVLLTPEGELITEANAEGLLCIQHPWPSILRTTYGDHERCRQTYFSTFKGYYFTGDGAKRDEQGNYRIIGRVDDVINVSGHRIGTAEVENAINLHPNIVESAVVGYPHDIKGEGIYAYVICSEEITAETLKKTLDTLIIKEIGPIAKADKIQVVPGLPKTRSGKIMRRILRKIAAGQANELGDTSTLLDPSIIKVIKDGVVD